MSELALSPNPAAAPSPLTAEPAPVFNCPECSHYLAEGVLSCPDCGTLRYAGHLHTLAVAATAAENEGHWTEAIELWRTAQRYVPAGSKQFNGLEERIVLLNGKLQDIATTKEKWTKRLGPLAPVVFFLAKAKSFLFVLFKLKFLLGFFGFFALYWALFGWRFGLGFTLSILVHEMGHYLAARRRGLKVDLPMFLPGLGAYVRWYAQGIGLEDLSAIALAGPFFGLLAAGFCGLMAITTHQPLWSALAHVGAWLNVINLIPVFGLDGAQATYALDRTQRWLILATALLFFGMLREGVFAFVAIGMAWRLWQGGHAEKPSTRTLVRYVLLLFALGVLSYVFPDTRRYSSF